MKNFQADALAEKDTASRVVVDQVCARIGIAIDEGGKIQHEWFQQCQSGFFKEWFVQQIKLGRIRMVLPFLEQRHKKALMQRHGFPKSYDMVYVAVANATTTRYIVTDDIDFFDPKLKPASADTKQDAKERRDGPVCRYLLRELEIRVGLPAHAAKEILGLP